MGRRPKRRHELRLGLNGVDAGLALKGENQGRDRMDGSAEVDRAALEGRYLPLSPRAFGGVIKHSA